MRLTRWLRRRREEKVALLERVLKAHADYERDLAILTRDDPHRSYAFPPAGRPAYRRYQCGCVQFHDGGWERCSPHAVIHEMETWRT